MVGREAAMRLVIDRDRCIGSGQCVLTDPAVFDQDEDDGRVVFLAERIEEVTPAISRAVGFCPSGALTLADD
jgi:ferredoxin